MKNRTSTLKGEIIMTWMNDEIFVESVRKYFSFLRTKYNMHIDDNSIAGCVRFKSNIAWAEIWCDKYSLFIEMGTSNGLCKTSLWDIMQYVTGKGESASYMASDEEKLENGLRKLSDYVKLYCREALLGNAEFYNNIQKGKEAYEKECAFRNKIGHIEELAKAAWEKQGYIEIINLYEPIAEFLSPLQKKRLSICKKRLNDSSSTHCIKRA
jgi:hypothetical protein